MNVFESIADRRIQAGREAGLFDNLPGAGKPIPDLGQERPAGWWAARVAKQERSKLKAEDLDRSVRAGRAVLWRLDSEADVRLQVDALNQMISDYNRVTTWEERQPLDVEHHVDRWRQLRSPG